MPLRSFKRIIKKVIENGKRSKVRMKNSHSSNEINNDDIKGEVLIGEKGIVEKDLSDISDKKKELMDILEKRLDFLSGRVKDRITKKFVEKRIRKYEKINGCENIRREMFLYFYFIEQAKIRNIEDNERKLIHRWRDSGQDKLNSFKDDEVAILFYAAFRCDGNHVEKKLFNECKNRRTMLSSAAGLLSENILKVLIENIKDVNIKTAKDSITPLHTATMMGKLKNVELLLDEDADPTIEDEHGNMPIHRAANVNTDFLEKNNKNIKQDMINIAKLLVAKGASAESQNKEGYTAFHLAAKASNVDMIRLFLKKGARIDHISKKGETALHLAVSSGHQEAVAYLIAQGADPCVKDEKGRTPLYRALVAKQPEIIDKFNLSQKDKEGNTKFHFAARNGDINIMALLVERVGKLQLNDQNNNQETPLHLAAAFGHVEAVSRLIKDGADLNAKDVNGYTPLYRAVLEGHHEVARELHPDQQDEDGNTFLHRAAMSGHEKIVDFLIKAGARINIKNKKDHTPLECALLKNHHKIVSKLNPNQPDKDGNTLLHLAVGAGVEKMVACLIKAGADTRIRNKEGQTPLECALAGDRADIVQLLGPDVQDEKGDTALHHAVREGDLKKMKLLLDAGASCNIKNVMGQTVMESAFDKKKWNIVKELWDVKLISEKCNEYFTYMLPIERAIKYCEKRSTGKTFKRWLPFFTSMHCFNRFSKEEKLGAVKAALQAIWEGKTLSDLEPKYRKALRSGELKETGLIDLFTSSNQHARSATPVRPLF